MSRAVDDLPSTQEWQARAIEVGVAEADAADAVFLDHAEVAARVGGHAAASGRTAARASRQRER